MGKIYKLLLKQHIGAPDSPIVKEGDMVKRGALIAEPTGLGANIHASVSGKIRSVTAEYIEIEADDQQPDDFVQIPQSDSIVEMVKSAGLVGMGGAGFPTHVKLSTDLNGGVIICNAVECEPLLKHNIYKTIHSPEKIYRGMLLSMQATKAGRGIFAIKSKNKEAIEAFRKVIRAGDNIEIAALEDMYPMGEERAIIRETLNVLLGVDQLPAVAGAVILNAETLIRVAEAVDERRPVMTKDVTVVGKLKSGKNSHVLIDVPMGTSVGELIERAGGLNGEYGEIIMGGPFTGQRSGLDGVTIKTTGGIIVTMEFLKESRPMGLLVCACGGNEARLRQLAQSMNATVVGVQKCKQAIEVKGGALKCENPGNCPGQAEKIMKLRAAGAQSLLVSNCSDCTNTVMCVAPKLKMAVHHCTDHVMRTVGHSLIRRLPIAKE